MSHDFARAPHAFLALTLCACLLAACATKDIASTNPPGGTPDTTPPTVSSTNPPDGASGVATGATISVTFSESMNASSINPTTFAVGGASGSIGVNGAVATFFPSSALAASTDYTVTVMGGPSGAKDAAGNPLASNQVWTFRTAAAPAPDTTPPTVSSTNPPDGASGISTGAAISVTFSEAMSAASINTSSFTVGGVTGTVSASGAVATFTPSAPLQSSTPYTATVLSGPGGVKDAAGNPLAADFSWTFTTGTPPSCASASVHCVDDTPGPNQEFTTIQAAVSAAQAGHTVLVFDGSYAGFVVSRSGTSANRITIKAEGSSAVINQTNSNGEGITISNASFVTVEGFTVIGMPDYGLATHNASPTNPMHGLIIRNNTVHNSDFVNIYASEVADSLIEGNTASGSATSHGIYLANGGSDNTIIRGNRCFNNAKNGIHLNGDLSIGGDGLHTGITIENNVIFGNTANGLDLDGIQDSVIRNNLIYNNGNHALRAFAIDAAAGPKNLNVVNNTFVVSSGGGWPIKIAFSSDRPSLHDLGGHTIFNNILVNNGGNGSIVVENPNFQSNHNVVKDGFSLDGEVSTISLSQWQAAGHGQNSIVSTSAALFTNPGSADFTLKALAPAANAGVASFNSVSAPGADILGVVRPQGSGYDIGAYESF